MVLERFLLRFLFLISVHLISDTDSQWDRFQGVRCPEGQCPAARPGFRLSGRLQRRHADPYVPGCERLSPVSFPGQRQDRRAPQDSGRERRGRHHRVAPGKEPVCSDRRDPRVADDRNPRLCHHQYRGIRAGGGAAHRQAPGSAPATGRKAWRSAPS